MNRTRTQRGNRARAAAFAIAAAAMYVPANVLPILSTDIPGQSRTDTIFSGIIGLYQSGSWGIAIIVFVASILVPVLKILGIAVLLVASVRDRVAHRRTLTRLHAALDFIGRWSMLDVFLVAFLCGAVQFGGLAHVRAGPGIVAFASVVVLTMLATSAFDPRALWARETSAAETVA
jgi:paraquat-inducible protein A